jgi:acyl-CoA thioester hydrolase
MPEKMNDSHTFPWHVSFADTDQGGVVYYARYLEWAERARAQWIASLGYTNRALFEQGIVFAVKTCTIHYQVPGRLDDVLQIHTSLASVEGARLSLLQQVRRDATECVRVEVELACLTTAGKPTRIPPFLRTALRNP